MTHRWLLIAVVVVAIGRAAALGEPPGPQVINGKVDDPSPVEQPESPDVPVPFLTAEQEVASFNLPPGFKAEVVAAEPMVEHPIALAFDSDGRRIWVCEMRGYMPNFQGAGEEKPVGRISVLEDTDGDGRMDKASVFLDGLVMPRAVGLARDGVLVGVPPNLLFCRDSDGDGKCDQQAVVASDYGDGYNPENQANGLMYGIDNWVYSSAYGRRFREEGVGKFTSDVIPIGGQFGITQDDVGRQFFNTNSDYLRGNLVPPQYTIRNPHYRGAGDNVQIDHDQNCWPAIPSGVNRGYRANWLRDGRLRDFTAACSPCIYRGGLFGPEFEGNAFVCEPSANLIRRSILTADGNKLTAHNAHERREFLASTNERFRPVNLYTGPEGALYIVDMAQGILQHRLSLTAYLREKYHKRELDQHLDAGRIFRIVRDGTHPYPRQDLSKAKSAELVEALTHPNGWRRDTAQRLLVERNESASVPRLKAMLKSGAATAAVAPAATPTTAMTPARAAAVARIHALWTLEGMRRLDSATAKVALADADPQVRAMAIRAGEALLASPRRAEVLPDVLRLAGDADPRVRLQFALTVSEVGTPEADAALARLLSTGDDIYTRDGAISGLRGRELEFLERLLNDSDWSSQARGRGEVLAALANAVIVEAGPKRVDRMLSLAASQSDAAVWRRAAIAKGIAEAAAAKPLRRPIVFASEPAALVSLTPALGRAAGHFVWPGKPGYAPPTPPAPLTALQQARFELGQQVFAKTCVQCHKPDGMGLKGLAPPLVGSEWVLGPEQRIARIVLSGLRGPVTVNGDSFNLDMPSLAALSDEQIAGALTFVRRSWDNDADPVEPATVARIRAEIRGRTEAWTERELLTLNLPAVPARPKLAATQPATRRAAPPLPPSTPSSTPRAGAG